MRVRIVRGVVIGGQPTRPGQTVEVGEALGQALIRSGRAALIPSDPAVADGGRQTAVDAPYSTAVAPETATETAPETGGYTLPDRLTAIKGIGAKTQEALNLAGVRTFRELADADADALAAALDGSSPAQVRRWQADAIGFLG